MYGVMVSCTVEEISEYIRKKLSPEDAERFSDCEWAPVDIKFNTQDLCVEALLVPVVK